MPITVELEGIPTVIEDLRQQSEKFNFYIQVEFFTALRERTPIRTGRARRGWQKASVTTIVNKVPYIQYLEAGHSKQAPKGFVRQSQYEAIDRARIRFLSDQLFELRKLKGK